MRLLPLLLALSAVCDATHAAPLHAPGARSAHGALSGLKGKGRAAPAPSHLLPRGAGKFQRGESSLARQDSFHTPPTSPTASVSGGGSPQRARPARSEIDIEAQRPPSPPRPSRARPSADIEAARPPSPRPARAERARACPPRTSGAQQPPAGGGNELTAHQRWTLKVQKCSNILTGAGIGVAAVGATITAGYVAYNTYNEHHHTHKRNVSEEEEEPLLEWRQHESAGGAPVVRASSEP